jgi:hypothetical protein
MDKSDPVYAIIVEMANTLVPDVCRIIMDYLEQIHIDLGYKKWRDRMETLVCEYSKTVHVADHDVVYFQNSRYSFSFNYRDVSRHSHLLYSEEVIWHVAKNIFLNTSIALPKNYFHAQLYA